MATPMKEVNIKFQPVETPPKEQELLKDDARKNKDQAKTKDASVVWWSCPRCSYTILGNISVPIRNGRKCFHIMGHGSTSQTAKSGNYKLRAAMLRAVWNGRLKYTPGKLTKKDLILNKAGRVVPKKRSTHSKKTCQLSGWADSMRRWKRAYMKVRKEEGIVGFAKMKKTGTALEKHLYMKVVEATSQELVNDLNSTLQQMGSDKQMKITTFTSPNVKEAVSSSPQALVEAGA